MRPSPIKRMRPLFKRQRQPLLRQRAREGRLHHLIADGRTRAAAVRFAVFADGGEEVVDGDAVA